MSLRGIKEKFIVGAKLVWGHLTSRQFWLRLARGLWLYSGFFLLLLIFLAEKVSLFLGRLPLLRRVCRRLTPWWQKHWKSRIDRLIDRLDAHQPDEVHRSYLIRLAYKNMSLKKARSLITIGGMAVGIGAIVFLVSLGYGIERLVISRVARLEELKMTDVSPGESTALRLNDEAIKKISQIKNVEKVIPVVSVVGRVKFNNAVGDVLTYAAPRDYLDLSQIKLVKGEIFESNQIGWSSSGGKVAGAETELIEARYGEKIQPSQVKFNLDPEKAVLVWANYNRQAEVLGYTRRLEGGLVGWQYWGGRYYSQDETGHSGYDQKEAMILGRWIKAKVPLFEKNAQGELVPQLDDLGRQIWQWGWIMERDAQIIEVIPKITGQVLGEATESADLNSEEATESAEASPSASLAFETVVVSTDSAGIEWVQLQASDSAKKKEKVVLEFEEKPEAKALVSSGFLRMFALSPEEAIGQKLTVSFIIVKSLMPEIDSKVLSQETDYQIVGVIDDEAAPYLYVPLIDLRRVGVANFSQLRVVAKDKEVLTSVRKEIETLGFRTSSTVDTVVQIERLFKNVRLLLGILGMVALAVAVLGMFNTLTVSLLERTREIGGMKAMGMVSTEIRDLFLAEAMIMGLSGGIGGLVLGFLGGKALSILVSLLALAKGQGFLNLSYIPIFFTGFILVSSFIVGLLTGLYPARRATKISALNALRYE